MTGFPPVFVLRHGQTEWNVAHRFQGRLDSPLTALGRAQASEQNRILATQNLTGFTAYSSPQGRAFHSASIALLGLVPAIHTDTRLSEIGVGAWEGMKRADIQMDGPLDESEESALDLYERAPQGEGFAALRERCTEFLLDLKGPAVLVTHGITSRMLRLVLTDRDTSEIGCLPGGQGVVFHLQDGVHRQVTIRA